MPATQVPPWYAEGTAQYMARGAHHDRWDSHRDMILRVATLNGSLLGYDEMSAFGAKSGLGLEKVYDHGYALVLFIVNNFGDAKLKGDLPKRRHVVAHRLRWRHSRGARDLDAGSSTTAGLPRCRSDTVSSRSALMQTPRKAK